MSHSSPGFLGPTERNPAPWAPWLIAGSGLLVLLVPTLRDLLRTVWSSDDQAHGPIVLAVSLWLLWQQREHLLLDSNPRPAVAWPVLVTGALLYAVGRSQSILSAEVFAFIVLMAGLVLLLSGGRALRTLWFPFFFMIFMVPLPGVVVASLTQPMKLAVSGVAEWLLYGLGYPIARTGVMLQVGPYQLLVADACAGLHTLFTLEALGLLYLNVVRYSSIVRNVTLAILIVPISFTANVIRVVALTLITFYFGDEAGQGFLHSFAGFVLFLSALLLIMSSDQLLRKISLSSRAPQTKESCS